jgi:hypothetical protein
VRREGVPAQLADVVERVRGIPREPEGRVGNAEAHDVSRDRRDLGAHDHQQAVALALHRLGVEVVVIGDREKAQPAAAGRRDDFLRRSPSVGERRVDVDDARQPRIAVCRRGALHGQGPLQGHPPRSGDRQQGDREGGAATV